MGRETIDDRELWHEPDKSSPKIRT
jgi:hypothetical protein